MRHSLAGMYTSLLYQACLVMRAVFPLGLGCAEKIRATAVDRPDALAGQQILQALSERQPFRVVFIRRGEFSHILVHRRRHRYFVPQTRPASVTEVSGSVFSSGETRDCEIRSRYEVAKAVTFKAAVDKSSSPQRWRRLAVALMHDRASERSSGSTPRVTTVSCLKRTKPTTSYGIPASCRR